MTNVCCPHSASLAILLYTHYSVFSHNVNFYQQQRTLLVGIAMNSLFFGTIWPPTFFFLFDRHTILFGHLSILTHADSPLMRALIACLFLAIVHWSAYQSYACVLVHVIDSPIVSNSVMDRGVVTDLCLTVRSCSWLCSAGAMRKPSPIPQASQSCVKNESIAPSLDAIETYTCVCFVWHRALLHRNHRLPLPSPVQIEAAPPSEWQHQSDSMSSSRC